MRQTHPKKQTKKKNPEHDPRADDGDFLHFGHKIIKSEEIFRPCQEAEKVSESNFKHTSISVVNTYHFEVLLAFVYMKRSPPVGCVSRLLAELCSSD